MPNNIKRERVEAGISVDEAADVLGVHPNTVRGWERGEFEPTGKNLVQLSALFGCGAGYLLGLTNERSPRSSVGDAAERREGE